MQPAIYLITLLGSHWTLASPLLAEPYSAFTKKIVLPWDMVIMKIHLGQHRP